MFNSLPLGIPQFGAPIGSPLFNTQSHQPPTLAPVKQDNTPPEIHLPRSINYYADYSGCGFWRMIWPEHLLNAHHKAVVHGTTMMVLDERYYQNTKAVRVQRQATESQLMFTKLLKDFQKRHNFRLIYEIDDIVFHEDIPDYNRFKSAFTDPKIRECSNAIMREADEITVTCEFMKEYYIEKTGNKNITVIPNYPPKWWLGNFYDPKKIEENYMKNKRKPRIVYAASGAHFDVDNRVGQKDDFHHVNDVIAKTVDKYQWVFVGAYPLTLTPLVKTGKIEFHNWQRLYDYPALINSLRPNMMIAPLIDNTFNRAKSDLKHIEASCLGVPIACQDICTYKNAPIKFNNGDEMIDQISKTMKWVDDYMKASKAGRSTADTRWLEVDSNIDKYAELYNYSYQSPERKHLNSLEENRVK